MNVYVLLGVAVFVYLYTRPNEAGPEFKQDINTGGIDTKAPTPDNSSPGILGPLPRPLPRFAGATYGLLT